MTWFEPQAILTLPVRINRRVGALAMLAARFLVDTGRTPGERVFWRVGGAISAIGACIVIASEAGAIAALLQLRAWRTPAGCGALAFHAFLIWLVGHLLNALLRAIRKPSDESDDR